MPRSIIQVLTILTLVILTPRIVLTILKLTSTSEVTYPKSHNYKLVEIKYDYRNSEKVNQIDEKLKNLPNFNKIRQEKSELLIIQVKTRILLRKIQKKIKEKEKQLEQYSQSNHEESNKS